MGERFYRDKNDNSGMPINMWLKRMFLNYVPPVIVFTAYEYRQLYYSNDFETHLARLYYK